MQEIDIATIKKRSIHSVIALTSRSLFIQIFGQGVGLLLTYYLAPEVFGLYAIVTALIGFLVYFSDIGLAGALIQKKDDVTKDDLRTTFTIQEALVLFLCVTAFAISPVVANFYQFNSQVMVLYWSLIFSFFISSLKTIPSILLERKLEFQKLVIPELVETIVFNSVVLYMAVRGVGIESFSVGVVARAIFGFVTLMIISPWKFSFGFSKQSAVRLLTFGVPFQANSILALIKDNAFLLFLGKVLSFSELGYIGFAQKITLLPLRLVMDNLIRVTFPSYSRLSHDSSLLGKAIEKTIFAITVIIFPLLTGIVFFFPVLISLIPKYEKWEPAYFSLVIFAIQAGCSALSTPLINALNAIGKIKISLFFMGGWTIATWVITPIAISFFGYNAVSVVSLGISLSVIFVIAVVKQYVSFQIGKIILIPFFATICMGGVLFFSQRFIQNNLFLFIGMGFISLSVYLSILFILAKEEILADIKMIRENIKR